MNGNDARDVPSSPGSDQIRPGPRISDHSLGWAMSDRSAGTRIPSSVRKSTENPGREPYAEYIGVLFCIAVRGTVSRPSMLCSAGPADADGKNAELSTKCTCEGELESSPSRVRSTRSPATADGPPPDQAEAGKDERHQTGQASLCTTGPSRFPEGDRHKPKDLRDPTSQLFERPSGPTRGKGPRPHRVLEVTYEGGRADANC